MWQTALLLLAALGGSLHCLGMCGVLITRINTLTPDASHHPRLVGHVFYHGGRLTSYMFLGALAGAGGQLLTHPSRFLHTLIDLGAGFFVLFTGLRLAGCLPTPNLVQITGIAELTSPFKALLRIRRLSTAIYLGLFNGFIPCPLIAAFLAQAAASGSPLSGALIMAALVVGTAPGMLLFGYVTLSPALRGKAVQTAGVLLIVLGGTTLLHAMGAVPSPLGSH